MRLARLRTARRRTCTAAAAALLATTLAPAAGADETYQTYFASADGTSLHAEVFKPAGKGRRPVVLIASPYHQTGSGKIRNATLQRLVDRGYVVVQASLRGYGASGGCGDFGGTGEQADVKAAVEWSASQAWSSGRVGMIGVSYDAWTQVMALATKPRGLSAVLIQSPLVSLYRGLYMNGAHYGGGWHTTPAGYAQIDLTPPPPGAGVQGMQNALTGTALGPTCYADNNTQTANPDRTTAYWKERDLVARARTSKVPVLWSHGFADHNTKPDNLSALYPLLRGPKRAWVGQFGHAMPQDPNDPDLREQYLQEAFAWLDAYVKRDPRALREVQRASGSVVQQGDRQWRRDDAWPPRDASFRTTSLRSGTYTDTLQTTVKDATEAGAVHWTFSQPLPYDVHLSGVPRVTLTAKGRLPAQVVVKVYDVEGEGAARMVTRGVHAAVDGKVSFDLFPQDWRFERGHRIGVAIAGSDGGYWSPSGVSGQVAVSGASLSIPALRYDRTAFFLSDGGAPPAELTVQQSLVTAAQHTFTLPPRLRRR